MTALTVDPKGLVRWAGELSPDRLLMEIVQNAFDASADKVDINSSYGNSEKVVVSDTGEGFEKLDDTWVVFGDSRRATDPEKRGRFGLGEKLVAACVNRLSVHTTCGKVVFWWNSDGMLRRRVERAKTREIGTEVEVTFKNVVDANMAMDRLRDMIVPSGIEVTVDAKPFVAQPEFDCSTEASLPTVISDGVSLRPTVRKTKIDLYERVRGAWLCEMGIPVVEIECPWSVNVHQCIPLSVDRTEVSRKYLQKIYAAVANAIEPGILEGMSRDRWVSEALRAKDLNKESAGAIRDGRFGRDALVAAPSDKESISQATAAGHSLIWGGSLDTQQWEHIRPLVKTTAEVYPSPKCYDPEGRPEQMVPKNEWTEVMQWMADTSKEYAGLMGQSVWVYWVHEPQVWWAANCGPSGKLTFNTSCLDGIIDINGKKCRREAISLIIHELGHLWESDHLSAKYHKAICDLAAAVIANCNSQKR